MPVHLLLEGLSYQFFVYPSYTVETLLKSVKHLVEVNAPKYELSGKELQIGNRSYCFESADPKLNKQYVDTLASVALQDSVVDANGYRYVSIR
ncbi:hypothetical protein GGF40_002342 [Coemansia sp. RSA 1286]|nr:hypothetical protein GGF40_002342 [Coemansia sp. RSA 1286]